jgi:flavodoxin
MGWFGKNEKGKLGKGSLSALPELPKLPKLPQIGNKDLELSDEPISQLPSYPPDSFGEKFSQNAIKEAVTGKTGDKEVFDADESLDEIEKKTMPEPLGLTKSFHGNLKTKGATLEPVFVRIDKFEEGLKIFERTKSKISEIEKLLEEMKKINEKEERELQSWEKEIQTMKKNFEKINQDIFSKI